MHYYRSRHLLKDYELVLDWNSNWKSPNEDLDYEVDIDIDGPNHIEDYLNWWRGCHYHHISIHDVDSGEDEGGDEDIKDT